MNRVPIASLLMFVAATATAAETLSQFDQAQFEQRFRKADQGNKGKLSRAEAYAEFPRMAQYFDEIDRDKDGFITLDEVRQALKRYVDAAIAKSSIAYRYGRGDGGKADAGKAPAATERPKEFSSASEQRRFYRNEYYESLARDKTVARERGKPVSDVLEQPLLKKSF